MALLTTRQAASMLGLRKNTLEVWRVQGAGPVFCKFQKAVRYKMEDLEAFIENSRRTNTSNEKTA